VNSWHRRHFTIWVCLSTETHCGTHLNIQKAHEMYEFCFQNHMKFSDMWKQNGNTTKTTSKQRRMSNHFSAVGLDLSMLKPTQTSPSTLHEAQYSCVVFGRHWRANPSSRVEGPGARSGRGSEKLGSRASKLCFYTLFLHISCKKAQKFIWTSVFRFSLVKVPLLFPS